MSETSATTTEIGIQMPGDQELRTTECGAAISNERMEKFLATFEASARRWEIVVYPALFAFVILAGYGFFLVYSLTKDVSVLAASVERSMAQNLQTVAANMNDVSKNVANMSAKMDQMTTEMGKISTQTEAMAPISNNLATVADHIDNIDSMQSIDQNISQINRNIGVMSNATDQMRHDVGSMNRNISPAMHFMNGWMPW